MNHKFKVIISRNDLYSNDYSNLIEEYKESDTIVIKNSLVELIAKFIKEAI